jgi:hypothetical protein
MISIVNHKSNDPHSLQHCIVTVGNPLTTLKTSLEMDEMVKKQFFYKNKFMVGHGHPN